MNSIGGLNLDLLDEVAFTADTSISDQGRHSFQVEDASTFVKLLKVGQRKQVKEIIRSHNWPVDHPIRRDLWIVLCQHLGKPKYDSQFYDGMVKELFGQVSAPPSLPSFCDPIYCDSFYLNAEGHQAAERILFIVAYNDPSITYSPLLYSLTCIFLHYMAEDKAFLCIADLLAAKQEDFVTQNKMGHDANSYVAMKLTKKYAKQGFIQLQEIKKNPDAMLKAYRRWLCWIFRGLPFYHLVRVIDCFLMEGSKVLLRTLLAVLMCLSKYSGASNKTEIQNKSPSKGLSERIFNYTQNNLGPVDKFLKTSFGIRGLSRTEIHKCLVKAEMVFKSQSVHQNRRVSMDTAPSSDSLYQLYMSSASINVKEIKLKCQLAAKAGSTGMIALKNFQSDILSSDQMSTLWSWLPTRITMFQPQLLYSTNEHGSSLTAFFMRVDAWEPTLLIVKAMNDEVFGAYCSVSWSTRLEQDESGNQRRYFGTGETFLFTLWPKACKYPWIGVDAKQSVGHSEELFMAANKQWICVGAGNGQALWLDESLSCGKTEPCDTFRNHALCSNSDFTCKIVEVAGFE